MATDPFPRDRVARMLHRLPAYLRLSWRLAREPLLSRARRFAVIGAAGYLASPIDLVPGVIPVLGQLDDVLVLPLLVWLALRVIPKEIIAEHRTKRGQQPGSPTSECMLSAGDAEA